MQLSSGMKCQSWHCCTAPRVSRSLLTVIVTTCLAATMLLVSSSVSALERYVRISQYLEKHPGQREVIASFSDRVRNDPEPILARLRDPVRIAMLYPSEQKSDYWERSRESFEKRMEALDIPYELKFYPSRPSGDAQRQSEQLADALAWRPDYLVFTLDTAPQNRMIEHLLANNRPKVMLQNITTPLTKWETNRPLMYVGFDHAQGSQVMAEKMLEDMEFKGKYLMLYFTPGYVSQMRGDTVVIEANRYPEVTQVAAYYTDGNFQKAYEATHITLKEHPDLKMIFACSTDIALGSLRALRELGRTDVMLNGWGGGDTELSELKADGLDLTVMRMNDDNGIAMAEAIKLDISEGSAQIPHIFPGDIHLLNNQLSEEDISSLKQRAFRLSGVPNED